MTNTQETKETKKESLAVRTSDRLDETIRTFFFAALIAMSIRAFAFEPFNIPSSSMVPGLLVGDYLFVSKYSYGFSSLSSLYGTLPMKGRLFFSEPKRGDVVVFKLPSDNSTDYIKRLVGLPGDRIQMRNGLLYINGVAVNRQKLPEPTVANYLAPTPNSVDYTETFPDGHQHIIREETDTGPLDDTDEFNVPDGHYFAMGDNRDNSQDSRTQHVSFIPAENLVGRARVLFFSIDEDSFFWQLWKWPSSVRWKRLFMTIK